MWTDSLFSRSSKHFTSHNMSILARVMVEDHRGPEATTHTFHVFPATTSDELRHQVDKVLPPMKERRFRF
jgi:hypothetical protein